MVKLPRYFLMCLKLADIIIRPQSVHNAVHG